MSERKTRKSVLICMIIFAVMILVHGFEAIVLRMDETIVGENFINKVFGIIVVFSVLGIMRLKPGEIGFAKKGFIKSVLLGIVLAATSFLVSFGTEIAIL